MRMAAPALWTVEQVLALPYDGNRYEVVHGELLVTPFPNPEHEFTGAALRKALYAYVDRVVVGSVLGPIDLYIGEDTYLQPDMVILPTDRAAGRTWREMPRPILCVEIISKSSRLFDREQKRRAYLEHGVPMYWIVDSRTRTVEVWTPAAAHHAVVADALTWSPVEGAEPFRITMGELFAGV